MSFYYNSDCKNHTKIICQIETYLVISMCSFKHIVCRMHNSIQLLYTLHRTVCKDIIMYSLSIINIKFIRDLLILTGKSIKDIGMISYNPVWFSENQSLVFNVKVYDTLMSYK